MITPPLDRFFFQAWFHRKKSYSPEKGGVGNILSRSVRKGVELVYNLSRCEVSEH